LFERIFHPQIAPFADEEIQKKKSAANSIAAITDEFARGQIRRTGDTAAKVFGSIIKRKARLAAWPPVTFLILQRNFFMCRCCQFFKPVGLVSL
jgi:hypothetical protein